MNQVDQGVNKIGGVGIDLVPANDAAVGGLGIMSFWPILLFIVVGGFLVMMVYKKFFE